MSVILFEHVEREYRIKESGEGIKNAIGSFVHPKYRTVQSIDKFTAHPLPKREILYWTINKI